jgi:PAS domain S-box-containing protein
MSGSAPWADVAGLVRPRLEARQAEARLQDALDRRLAESLPSFALGAGVVYVSYALIRFLITPGSAAYICAASGSLAGLLCFVLRKGLRWRAISPIWAHPFAAGIVFMGLFNSLLAQSLSSGTHTGSDLLLITLAAGSFFLSVPWLAFTLIFAVFLWALSPPYQLFNPRGLEYSASLATAIVIAAVIHADRIGKLRQIEILLQDNRKHGDELTRALSLANAVINNTSAAIFIKDIRGRYLMVNPSFVKTFGKGLEEVVGKTIGNIAPAESARVIEEHDAVVFGSGETHTFEEKGPLEEEGRILLCTKTPYRDSHGKIVGLIGITSDITERKRAEQELQCYVEELRIAKEMQEQNAAELASAVTKLQEAKMQAEEATHVKSDFLACMSHEIRTPLHGVLSMTEMLLETDLNLVQREYATVVRDSADALLAIINEILDLSKVEAGKLVLEQIPFDLWNTVRHTVELLAAKARDKGLELRLRFAEDAARHIVGDPGRIRQVLVNLIGNALKFTEAGHIFIEVSETPEPEHERQAQFRISVEDTGIGVPPGRMEQLFEKFTQADASTTRRFGGTGLGLSISRQLARLMHGDIYASSEPGKGSVFTFEFRAEIAISPAGKESSDELGIAICIPDAQVRTTILRELEGKHCHAIAVASVEALQESLENGTVEGRRLRSVVLDATVPELLEVAWKVQNSQAEKGIALIVLCDQISNCVELHNRGAAIISKPVSGSRLCRALARALAGSEGARGAVLPSVTSTLSEKEAHLQKVHPRILLAEDSPVNQTVARLRLRELGCSVDIVSNGEEAVEVAAGTAYDLILMDCEMPEMDGFEATSLIRKREGDSKRVPIVAVTAHAIAGYRERCTQAGMDGYLSKPFGRSDLIKLLAAHMPASSPENAPPEKRRKFKEVLDRFDGDEAVLQAAAACFLQDVPKLMATIRAAVESGDQNQLIRPAHTLKGAISHFDTGEAFLAAGKLEEAARKEGASDFRGMLQVLENRMGELQSALGRILEEVQS